MKTKRQSILFIAAALTLIISSCSEKVAKLPTSNNAPIEGFQPEYAVYQKVNVELGDTLRYKTGTTILIPPGALLNAKGEAVKGEVQLKYREFHDAIDIVLAGAKMQYDTGGVITTLQTAGMFDINATQNGEQLFINPEKNINVRMASYEQGNQYNFYFFDEKTQNWSYQGTDTAEVNQEKFKLIEEIEKAKPGLAFPLNKEFFAFNYHAILDVYYNEDYSKIRKNWNSKAPGHKAKQYGLTWSEIDAYQDITFRGNRYPANLMLWKMHPVVKPPKWTKDGWVDKLTYLGNNFYLVKIKDRKERVYSMKVEAIMPLKYLFRNTPEYWKQNYEDALAEVKELEDKLKFEADVYRTFSLNQFGMHNWDVIKKFDSPVLVKGNFEFDKNFERPLEELQMYYFVSNNKSFVKFSKNYWDKIQLVDDSTAHIMTFLGGREIAVFSNEDYKKIDLQTLATSEQPTVTFKMKSVTLESPEDIKTMLGI